MGYVAVKGGGTAIAEAELLLNVLRTRGAVNGEAPLDLDQIQHQLHFLHSQVMSEGGLYDEQLASLALKQSLGDVLEAAFFLRAFKATRPRLGATPVLDTSKMRLIRRISSAFKEIPGGQILGPTPDYSHRLLDFELIAETPEAFREVFTRWCENLEQDPHMESLPKVVDFLREQGIVEEPTFPDEEPYDITRQPITFPMPRSGALTMLARSHRGSLLALAYSSFRGYGGVHPTVAELRVGYLPVEMPHPVTGEPMEVGEVLITECDLFTSSGMYSGREGQSSGPPKIGLGYGVCFGHNEVKAISMGTLERAIRGGRREGAAPAEDPEFVLYHTDGLESFGFCIHFKMPHYVTFQSGLNQLRAKQQDFQRKNPGSKSTEVG
ncbi:MAG: carbon-phosphorus lyase complex subunit PhnI [Capsulimonadales bacterium]|nr:carbon-phosphorus lyase complex subunit PhnI [Capsulimonadales bacterium]